MNRFKYYTPVITVFDKTDKLDIKANRAVWEHLISGGIDGLVVLGSIGEFFTLTMEEKKLLIKEAATCINKRCDLYVGTCCPTTTETIELSNYALEQGIDAVMIIGPYYFPLTQSAIESHFSHLAKSINGEVILYNFPDRTGYTIEAETAYRLAQKHRNITGYKDTTPLMRQTALLAQTMKKDFPTFKIYSGFDEFFTHNVISGGDGCIGGLSNIYPALFSRWSAAINSNQPAKVVEIQRVVDKLMELYSIGDVFISTIKEATRQKGLPLESHCKAPYGGVSDETKLAVASLLKKVDEMIIQLS